MVGINYLLVEANRIKVGGYSSIGINFLYNLIDYIYTEKNKFGSQLKAKFSDISVSLEGKVYVTVPDLAKNLVHNSKKLAGGSNPKVRNIYLLSRASDSYKELGFIMFLTGIVNSYDYLRYNTDIGYVTSKFSVGIDNSSIHGSARRLIKPIRLTNMGYVNLMGMYLKLSSEGINFGFCIYDYVHHMLVNVKNNMGTDYARVLKKISDLGITDFSRFNISEGIVGKYKEEVGVLLPLLVESGLRDERVIFSVLEGLSTELLKVVLRNERFLSVYGNSCIFYSM